MNAITIAHLSDIHHNPDENSQISTLLREKGLLVEKLLGQCLETLKQRKPDIVLITGDMTMKERPAITGISMTPFPPLFQVPRCSAPWETMM